MCSMPQYKCNKLAKTVIRIIWLITLIAFVLFPIKSQFKIGVYCIIFSSYIVSVLLFFYIKGKRNYFDFDVVFIAISSLIYFLAPFFTDNEIFPRLFIVGFESNLILKGTLLASVGIESYIIGSIMRYKPKSPSLKLVFPKGEMFAQFFIVCSAIFVLSGGIDYFKSIYNSENSHNISGSGLIQQMIPLMVVFSNLFCVSVFIKIRDKKPINWLYITYIFAFSFLMALIGNRTLFSNLLLPYVMCYFSYVKKISWRKTLVLFMVGIFLMSVIQITRTGGSYYSRSFILMFTDLTIPSSTLYNSLEYVDLYGITYLKTMLAPLIACIPGLGSIFSDINSFSSASVLTNYMITESWMEGTGMGSTIISDLYLGGGIIIVVVFMILLGRLINILNFSDRLDYMAIKCAFYSSCIFMCRSAYFYPARFIIWSLLIIYGYNYIVKSYGRNR